MQFVVVAPDGYASVTVSFTLKPNCVPTFMLVVSPPDPAGKEAAAICVELVPAGE